MVNDSNRICTVKFGVYAHPLVQYIHSKSVGRGGGGAYAHAPLLCTESMHLQSTCLQRPRRYVCTTASVDLLAYTHASKFTTSINRSHGTNCGVGIYWYKLPHCKTLALKWEGGGLYSKFLLLRGSPDKL